MASVAGVAAGAWLVLQGLPAEAQQAGRVGRAVIAGFTPGAVATHPDKTTHDYPKGRLTLHQGMALSELHTLETDEHGRMCMVLTPGALACVRPSSSVRLDRLEQMTDGLPEVGKDLLRRIDLTVTRGALMLHAGPPSPNLSIRLATPAGTVEAHGGEFVVMEDREKGGWLVGAYRSDVTFTGAGGPRSVPEGKLLRLTRDGAGNWAGTLEDQGVEPLTKHFDMCMEFFPDLDPYVFRPEGIDMDGLSGWIDEPGGVVLVGDPLAWADVSPSVPLSPPFVPASSPAAPGARQGGRWSGERVWDWYRSLGVVRGVNFLPSSAVDDRAFWTESGFDADAIGKELRWARESGFNAVRVQLAYSAWAEDSEGFTRRVRTFLDLAARNGLGVVPVLLNNARMADQIPLARRETGKAAGTVPGRAPLAAASPATLDDLERYVRDMTGTFRTDRRVTFWDAYNLAGGNGVGENSLALLERVFQWVREERTKQPVTAAAWGDASDPISARLMELSDFVTFQDFNSVSLFQARLRVCETMQRPVFCSDWLRRREKCTFADILPVLADRNVGWFSHGLVRGRAAGAPAGSTDVWQQDVLWPDGTPYDRQEIDLIKAFKFGK